MLYSSDTSKATNIMMEKLLFSRFLKSFKGKLMIYDIIQIRLAEKLRKTCKWYKRIDRLPVREQQFFAAIKAALYQINYWVTWEPAFPITNISSAHTQTCSHRDATATSKSLRDPAGCTEPTSQTTHTHKHNIETQQDVFVPADSCQLQFPQLALTTVLRLWIRPHK